MDKLEKYESTGDAMYGPVASKVAIRVMVVLGFGTYVGVRVLAQESITARDIITIGVCIFGVGAAWTTLKDDIKQIRKEFLAEQKLSDIRMRNGFKLINMRLVTLSKRMDDVEHKGKQ